MNKLSELKYRRDYTRLVRELLIELKGETWAKLYNGLDELVERGLINEFRKEKIN